MLKPRQRQHLRGLAHALDPIVVVGKEGVSEKVIAQLATALRDHELVKVRVLEASPTDRRESAELLAAGTQADVVTQIGRVIVVFKAHPEKPRIALPK